MYIFPVTTTAVWLVGTIANLGVRLDHSQEDDTPTAIGKSILWPLFALRYLGLALYRGLVALFTLP